MVVKIGGAAIDDPARADSLWAAIVDAHRVLAGQLILVHGGGGAVDRHLDRLGMKSERRDGIRVTPREQIDEVVAVLAGRVNKAIVGAIQQRGVPAMGLCLGDGNTATTTKASGYSFDPGFVGQVTGGNPSLLAALMAGGFLPVLCSIGLAADGSPLNVNADDAAAAIAQIVRASRLVLMTDVPGVLDAHRRPLSRLTPAEVESLITAGTISGGMIPKTRAAARAAQSSGAPCTIASWNTPGDLLRLARGEGAGTTIVAA
jgi:acetylglutamate kinase